VHLAACCLDRAVAPQLLLGKSPTLLACGPCPVSFAPMAGMAAVTSFALPLTLIPRHHPLETCPSQLWCWPPVTRRVHARLGLNFPARSRRFFIQLPEFIKVSSNQNRIAAPPWDDSPGFRDSFVHHCHPMARLQHACHRVPIQPPMWDVGAFPTGRTAPHSRRAVRSNVQLKGHSAVVLSSA
jgi:hypothetical protein